MQECETGTGKSSTTKRVSVRSGGAGHAQSGVATNASAAPVKAISAGKLKAARQRSLSLTSSPA
jgi:hypothetical protein